MRQKSGDVRSAFETRPPVIPGEENASPRGHKHVGDTVAGLAKYAPPLFLDAGAHPAGVGIVSGATAEAFSRRRGGVPRSDR
jgi:hypothetical protein